MFLRYNFKIIADVLLVYIFLQMTSSEITELLARMGVANEEGVGIPYHSLVQHLAQVLDNRQ